MCHMGLACIYRLLLFFFSVRFVRLSVGVCVCACVCARRFLLFFRTRSEFLMAEINPRVRLCCGASPIVYIYIYCAYRLCTHARHRFHPRVRPVGGDLPFSVPGAGGPRGCISRAARCRYIITPLSFYICENVCAYTNRAGRPVR